MIHRAPRSSPVWLFSPRNDWLAFGGSTVLSLLFLGIGYQFGFLDGETPEWVWVASVLLVDVAHVYATLFRVYTDPKERQRRPWLYYGTPLAAWFVGLTLYSTSPLLFWRVLAYIAVFHFVRQQAGWLALYHAKDGSVRPRWCDRIETIFIYAATLYPLTYWHANPREFSWFVVGDFLPAADLAQRVEAMLRPFYWMSLVAAVVCSGWAHINGRGQVGKDLLIFSTFLCWYLGIVAFNSDYAFTVTNVFVHGIPYMFLVATYTKHQSVRQPTSWNSRWIARMPWIMLVLLWCLAFTEEWVWNGTIWHERDWFFDPKWEVGEMVAWIVPLLAVPQFTHYVLDGFVWKRKANPAVATLLQKAPA